jgi:threonyl-tRNA synthetase
MKRIPYLLIVGEQEAENQQVSVRRQGEGDKGLMAIPAFVDYIKAEVNQQLSLFQA